MYEPRVCVTPGALRSFLGIVSRVCFNVHSSIPGVAAAPHPPLFLSSSRVRWRLSLQQQPQLMSVFDKVRSIFKKDEGPSKPGSPVRGGGGPKIWTMPPEMQREFEKGVKYNMKVVIRGMRKTGKSALLARLHGHVFPETYVPSPEISAATIRYQGIDVPEDHGTKVEMWDVVDVGVHAGGRGASSAAPLAPLADATTIDVYRNCHCVIFMVDPMRKETLEYVLTESRNVPPTAAILVALNFMDLPKPHAVTERDVDEMCRRLQRASTPMIFLASQGNPPERSLSAGATWVSISSRTSYGLQVLRSFFEIPVAFVHLAALETQMKTLYQKVEVHQAWMLSERARLNFEEKERSKVPSEESLHDLQPSPIASPHAGRPTPPPPAASPQKQQPPKPKSDGETILVVIPSSKAPSSAPAVQQQALPHNTKKGGETMTAATAKKQQAPAKPSTAAQNSNELSNDFFGDVSDDDAPSSSSSSSEEEQITPARRSGTAGPFATAAQRRNSPPTDQRSNEHPPRSQAPVNSVPASSTTTASGPPHSIPPPLPSKSQALIVERAPVLRDGDCVVDESNSKVNDDFFGSDESDEEESQGSPEPKAPQQASRGSSTSEADEVQATGPHQSPPAKVAPPAAAVGTSSGVAFGSAVASPSVIKDDFFGGGSDEEEETIPRQGTSSKPPVNRDSDDDEDEGHEHKRVSPPRPTRPAAVPQARALGTAPVAGARSGKVVERRAPPPVVTKTAVAAPVPSIDVSALLAQMQSAIVNAPPQEMDDEDPEHGADVEKSHKRAKEKKEKSAKREKKEKKKKRSKTEGDSDDEDGGFVVED